MFFVIVSAIISSFLWYVSDARQYGILQEKMEIMVSHLNNGGTPDPYLFEPEKGRLLGSGYLVEHDMNYDLVSDADHEKLLMEIQSLEVNDIIFLATFSCSKLDENDRAINVSFWSTSLLFNRIDKLFVQLGLTPHEPSQQ